ncbi:hypothetical protein B0F90DRAFT_1781474 [Multifurca ochricompacta]|uniref:Uncharacterized protein n=1 Tax=Multifurca ochricompacta TaxID=376703 RepID=A0AAD4QJ20_9AGAM|nr:hypothetical protein B0F90DRAFT_1781474 [Multifurca ochricompacta]
MRVLLNVSDKRPRSASRRSDRTLIGEGEGFVAAKSPVSLSQQVMLVPEEVVLQEWVVQERLEGRVQEARRAGGERDRDY